MTTATNPLRTYDECDSCGEPVHTDLGPDRGWIHTVSGNYSCVYGFSGGMATPHGGTTDGLPAR